LAQVVSTGPKSNGKLGSILRRHQLVSPKKKQKTRKEKIIPQKIKAESSRVDQGFFSLFDGLFLSGELIIRSQISDQLENRNIAGLEQRSRICRLNN